MTTKLVRVFKRRLTVYDLDVIITFAPDGLFFDHIKADRIPFNAKQLEKPIKRKVEIMGKDFTVIFNRLGILFKQKSARGTGVLVEWEKAVSWAKRDNNNLPWHKAYTNINGFNPKSCIKRTRGGRFLAERY